MNVKICGIRTVEHALVAAEAGADDVGMILAPGRKRTIDAVTASRIVAALREDGRGVRTIGVFVDPDPAEVNAIAAGIGLDLVQLAGHESPQHVSTIQLPVVKVLRLGADTTTEDLLRQAESYRRVHPGVTFLVESDSGEGGTGVQADPAKAADLARHLSFRLAGGLTPENVAAAIRTVRPAGVDVSSGVERDGVKDPDRIRAFVQAARAALQEPAP